MKKITFAAALVLAFACTQDAYAQENPKGHRYARELRPHDLSELTDPTEDILKSGMTVPRFKCDLRDAINAGLTKGRKRVDKCHVEFPDENGTIHILKLFDTSDVNRILENYASLGDCSAGIVHTMAWHDRGRPTWLDRKQIKIGDAVEKALSFDLGEFYGEAELHGIRFEFMMEFCMNPMSMLRYPKHTVKRKHCEPVVNHEEHRRGHYETHWYPDAEPDQRYDEADEFGFTEESKPPCDSSYKPKHWEQKKRIEMSCCRPDAFVWNRFEHNPCTNLDRLIRSDTVSVRWHRVRVWGGIILGVGLIDCGIAIIRNNLSSDNGGGSDKALVHINDIPLLKPAPPPSPGPTKTQNSTQRLQANTNVCATVTVSIGFSGGVHVSPGIQCISATH